MLYSIPAKKPATKTVTRPNVSRPSVPQHSMPQPSVPPTIPSNNIPNIAPCQATTLTNTSGGMFRLFGSKKRQETKDPLKELRATLDTLDKREQSIFPSNFWLTKSHRFIESRIQNKTEQARKFANCNQKAKAINELRQKKILESQLETLAQSRMALDTQLCAMESSALDASVLSAMQSGASSMRSIHQNLSIGKPVPQTF